MRPPEDWAAPLPEEVQAYLRAAGQWSWPHRRAALRAELAANLYQAMLDQRLHLSEAQAWQAALREFGPPSRLWPFKLTLWRSGLALLTLGSVTYAAARSLGWP
ncbi:hypothetical protein [Deinococcus irradiatisoli]|uniref:hypothetical protein n=1 Tax=Deinococcus irradiatisoli TaxID=2202254 RepID=UPI0011B26720|nr:hypothetical protein [Deinococcus irradiatisoli]